MTALLFLLSAACPQTKMINKSKESWTDFDRKEMRYCQSRCPYEYKDAECLKKFFKLGYHDYYCECGAP